MLDLIFVVEDPFEWHQENFKVNRKHYSALKWLGPAGIASFQEHWAARVYFNTLVPYNKGLLKYGVISKASLITDLLDWEWLYISGRLHKPVRPLITTDSPELTSALQLNLQSAVHAALLLLPETFTEEALYKTLAGLSYSGDFRMVVGEDKGKVSKIVLPQLEEFRKLYMPTLANLTQHVELHTGHGEQDTSPAARLYHLNLLPKKILHEIVKEWNKDGRSHDVEDILRAAAHDTECPEVVAQAIRNTVYWSSLAQSLKGIVTAGLVKSVRYSGAKLKKMWKSLKITKRP
uniref:Phosphatidate cytidylyltransferase, mitochondrial n=1 Tax=Lynceus sp. MCZ IZ 141354 TaxID=1930659 RepID=A0A9N6WR69_9CRUS|nr:EOG090X06VP [Lynceus sp. MCZ IZ 141354]